MGSIPMAGVNRCQNILIGGRACALARRTKHLAAHNAFLSSIFYDYAEQKELNMSINDKIEEAIKLIEEIDDVAYNFLVLDEVEDKYGGPTPESWDWDEFFKIYPKFLALTESCENLASRSRADESDL